MYSHTYKKIGRKEIILRIKEDIPVSLLGKVKGYYK